MTGVLVLGAGGHGQVVADALLRAHEAQGDLRLIGFLDDNPTLKDTLVLGSPVLGPICRLSELDHDGVIVAIGDNRVRARVFAQLCVRREQLVNAIHPSAVIAPDVRLGKGVMIFGGVVVNTGTTVGDNVILNTGCTVDHHNHIGDHVHIAPAAHLGGDVDIGEGALIGISAIVMPQRRVGAWSVVSAGALVHANLEQGMVAAGVPARAIRRTETGD